jgi:TRAP-type C4-dicarboxylate transport system substrate-binding protein
MINCFDTTPILALSSQWFALAKEMTNMKWCPLIGATIITTHAWDKIPMASRPALLKAAAVADKRFRDDIRASSDKAIDVMKEHGLVVHDITAEQHQQWENLFQSVYPQISGTLIPKDIMDMAIKFRDESRAKKAAQAE